MEWSAPGYTEIRQLATGGSGRVVLALHEATGTKVAVKYLSERLLRDASAVARFQSEARLLTTLRDQHIATMWEYVQEPGGAAIVMELVNGVSLRRLLRENGTTGAEAALALLKGSLLGLARAHEIGLVHRDYKPENVVVREDGVSKLIDFGIAVRQGTAARPEGTPPYMAPELWAGGTASAATDVYAATAVFFECLTGHRPYRSTEPSVLGYQHLHAPVPVADAPPAVRGLVERGMAKHPSLRPPSAAEFVRELERVAVAGYGEDWEERGHRRLVGLLSVLGALFPAPPPGAPEVGTTFAESTFPTQPDVGLHPSSATPDTARALPEPGAASAHSDPAGADLGAPQAEAVPGATARLNPDTAPPGSDATAHPDSEDTTRLSADATARPGAEAAARFGSPATARLGSHTTVKAARRAARKGFVRRATRSNAARMAVGAGVAAMVSVVVLLLAGRETRPLPIDVVAAQPSNGQPPPGQLGTPPDPPSLGTPPPGSSRASGGPVPPEASAKARANPPARNSPSPAVPLPTPLNPTTPPPTGAPPAVVPSGVPTTATPAPPTEVAGLSLGKLDVDGRDAAAAATVRTTGGGTVKVTARFTVAGAVVRTTTVRLSGATSYERTLRHTLAERPCGRRVTLTVTTSPPSPTGPLSSSAVGAACPTEVTGLRVAVSSARQPGTAVQARVRMEATGTEAIPVRVQWLVNGDVVATRESSLSGRTVYEGSYSYTFRARPCGATVTAVVAAGGREARAHTTMDCPAGVHQVDVQRAYLTRGQGGATVAVSTVNDQPVQLTVTLTVDGRPVGAQTLDLSGATSYTRSVGFATGDVPCGSPWSVRAEAGGRVATATGTTPPCPVDTPSPSQRTPSLELPSLDDALGTLEAITSRDGPPPSSP
ncbi:serine/threonine-protein kinase [Nonomuraea longicatena]|uniref:Protein kinase domain-containing protein n=1 Tax=Nonomuraea longicatena TaxID=83682 RepID=A0ABN1NS76_9ACTN